MVFMDLLESCYANNIRAKANILYSSQARGARWRSLSSFRWFQLESDTIFYIRDGQPMAHALNLAHWMIWSGALHLCVKWYNKLPIFLTIFCFVQILNPRSPEKPKF